MTPESFCTCIYVYSRSAVTIDAGPAVALGANNNLVLIRLDPARTRVTIPRDRSAPFDLEKGIYKLWTGAEPVVRGSNIDKVILPAKDPPPDPTVIEDFRRVFPDVTHKKLKDFVLEDSMSFDLAGSPSAKAGNE